MARRDNVVAAFAGVWLGLLALPRVAPVLAPR